MDRPLILKGTFEQVQHDLAIINQIAAAWWAAQGEIVIDGKLYAKDADGNAILDGTPTTTWANPMPVDFTFDKEGEVVPAHGTDWFIPSPSSDPRFKDWRDHIPEGVTIECAETNIK